MKSSHNRKYVTSINAQGQTVHTTWRVWSDTAAGKVFSSEAEALAFYTETQAPRMDRQDTVILFSRDRMEVQ